MATPLLFFFFFFFFPNPATLAGVVQVEFLYPNFTTSNYLNIDNPGGIFLSSRNSTFYLTITNPGNQQSNFYLSIVHTISSSVVWSGNRNSPISNSGVVRLTSTSLAVFLSNNSRTPVWSTPPFSSPIHSLRLIDAGNLLLLDAKNSTLWQSFDHPTDTLLPGQALHSGASLISPVSDTNFAAGGYRLLVTGNDAILQWKEAQQYWSLYNDPRATVDFVSPVSYLATNASGLYLFSSGGIAVVVSRLPTSDLWIARLDPKGHFRIASFSSTAGHLVDSFVAPADNCDLPLACSSLTICSDGSNGSICTCPNLFVPASGGCVPADGSSLASPSACGHSPASYMSLGAGISYFGSKFQNPISSPGGSFASCESRCNGNCSCLGFFFMNSTGACYLLENHVGSLTTGSAAPDEDMIGYVKIFGGSTLHAPSDSGDASNVVAIVLPTVAAVLLVVVLFVVMSQWWRRRRRRNRIAKQTKSMTMKDMPLWPVAPSASEDELIGSGDGDDDEISIPGLPTRFTYAQLEAATNSFRTRIGSGGFGEVFKGTLPDKTEVAVKRIGAVGRRKEFFTEIAIIGSVHHINLVRLKGFCAQGPRRLLVYEYMNRGSLDKSLFGLGAPVLEWQERVDVAIGAARGLAYLHSGCARKIIHCDVKPENILLHDGGQVKISDFGLAKLLSPEQSGLFTTMRGTRGYLAPEWLTNAAISDRTDVYSFGMVLLEIIRGRKNRSGGAAAVARSDDSERWTGSASGGGGSGESVAAGGYFPILALEMHEQRKYLALADPRLEGRVSAEEVGRAVKVALCCLHEEPGMRPTMSAVVGMLEGTLPVWQPRVESLNFLKLYGRGFAAGESRIGNAMANTGGFGAGSGPSNTTSATTTESPNYSCLSSQQVSGPR